MSEDFEKLFRDELADLYDAEQQILKALPKLIEGASSTQLQEALQQHLTITEKQVGRLEEIFEEIGDVASKKCKGMAGLIAEGEHILEEDFDADVIDAAIIGAAQKVEHYEIAAYGTARTFAAYLGNQRALELLQESLDEEKEADRMLTAIAESNINVQAVMEGEQTDEGESRSRTGTTRPRTADRGTSSGRGKSRRARG